MQAKAERETRRQVQVLADKAEKKASWPRKTPASNGFRLRNRMTRASSLV